MTSKPEATFLWILKSLHSFEEFPRWLLSSGLPNGEDRKKTITIAVGMLDAPLWDRASVVDVESFYSFRFSHDLTQLSDSLAAGAVVLRATTASKSGRSGRGEWIQHCGFFVFLSS